MSFNNGAFSENTTVDYKKFSEVQFSEDTGGNVKFCYTTKGVAKLATSFNLGVEKQFEVPLFYLSRIADCKQMFPAAKDYVLSLYKSKEDF